MFSWFARTLRKSEAAVVAQNALEHMVRITGAAPSTEPRLIANRLVGKVWDHRPKVFDGRDGHGPLHKLTVAIAALAHGIHVYKYDSQDRLTIMIALGQLLAEAEQHGHGYGLTQKDYWLIRQSDDVFRHADRSY